ncbi:MAG: hypothetical protein ACYDA6_11075, partial [Solirubrobacteraceae bacterium]
MALSALCALAASCGFALYSFAGASGEVAAGQSGARAAGSDTVSFISAELRSRARERSRRNARRHHRGAHHRPRHMVAHTALVRPSRPLAHGTPPTATVPAASAPPAIALAGSPLASAGTALEGGEGVKLAEEADRASPEAVLGREESELKFAGLSGEAAGSLASESFPSLIDVTDGGPPALSPGESIASFPTTQAALLALPEGKHVLAESTSPMALETSPGVRKALDLSPTPLGGAFQATFAPIGARIPAHLSEGATLPASGVSITPVDQSGAPLAGEAGKIVGQSVFYAGAATDTDVAIRPTTTGVELSAILRSIHAPEALHLKLSTPAGASVKEGGAGSVEIVKEGAAIARLSSASASDAAGTDVPVTTTVSGDTVTLSISHPAGAYLFPIAVDPILEAPDANLFGKSKPTNWHFTQTASGYTIGLANPGNEAPGPWLLEPTPPPNTHNPGETGIFGYQTQGVSKIYAATLEASGRSGGSSESDVAISPAGRPSYEDFVLMSAPISEIPPNTISLCAAKASTGEYRGEIACAG